MSISMPRRRASLERSVISIERLPAVLKRFRLSRGLSQFHAARAAGIHLGSLCQIESQIEGTRISPLSKLLAALGYRLSELQAALDQPPLHRTWEADEPQSRDSRRRFPQAGEHLFPLDLLGPALAQIRIPTGLTQVYVGRACGLSRGQLCSYETGSGIPRVVTLCRILETLGSNLADFEGVIGQLRTTLPPLRRKPLL